MPLTTRALETPLSYADPQLYKAASNRDVLDKVAFASMTGVLHQLGKLANFSTDIFKGLYEEASALNSNIEDVSRRIRVVQSQIMTRNGPDEGIKLLPSPQTYDMDEETGKVSHGEEHIVRMQLFTPENRDSIVADLYNNNCMPAPALDTVDFFSPTSAPGGSGNMLKRAAASCSSCYSNPRFFYERWLQAEEKRQRIIQHRREEKRRRRREQRKERNAIVASKSSVTPDGETMTLRTGKRTSARRGSKVKHLNTRSLQDVTTTSTTRGADLGATLRRSTLSLHKLTTKTYATTSKSPSRVKTASLDSAAQLPVPSLSSRQVRCNTPPEISSLSENSMDRFDSDTEQERTISKSRPAVSSSNGSAPNKKVNISSAHDKDLTPRRHSHVEREVIVGVPDALTNIGFDKSSLGKQTQSGTAENDGGEKHDSDNKSLLPPIRPPEVKSHIEDSRSRDEELSESHTPHTSGDPGAHALPSRPRSLLSDVENFKKAKLKRRLAPASSRSTRRIPDARRGLLSAIRSGAKLKKVDTDKLRAERANGRKSTGVAENMASSIHAIMARRGQIRGGSSDSDSDGDWSDND